MQDSVGNVDLCALMDGECSPETRGRIEAELARSPQCERRLTTWRRNDAALRFTLSAGLADHLGRGSEIAAMAEGPSRDDGPLRNTTAALRKRSPHSTRAAVAVAAFAGGSGAAALALLALMLSGR